MKKTIIMLLIVAAVSVLVALISNSATIVHTKDAVSLIAFTVIAVVLFWMAYTISKETKEPIRSLPVNLTGNMRCDIIDSDKDLVLYTEGTFVHIIEIRTSDEFTCGISMLTSTGEELSLELISEIDNLKMEV